MSLKEPEMQAVSLLGAVAISAALIVPVVWFSNDAPAAPRGPVLKDMQVIEATLAFKSEKAPKQPQKKFDTPEIAKPEGVSRDENKKVEEKKDKKEDKPKIDDKDPFKDFRRNPDEPEGKPTTQPGEFNGNERGFAPESKGDPFFGRLRADMNFQFPEIAKAASVPIGCIKLQPDGRIAAITFDPPHGERGSDDIQIAAEASLKNLQKTRNREPEPVPTHLLQITGKWLCFKFSVSSG